MASSNTGGWVRRVGSSGPGKTYRQRRPLNYYGVIIAICVLGTASIALARYDYRHPAGAAAAQQPPTTSQIWFAGLGISTCGGWQPSLLPNRYGAISGFQAIPNGVIQIAPTKANQTGSNATLAKFVNNYAGFKVTPSQLTYPPQSDTGKPITFKTGEKCPAGTKDAGKVGHVEIAHWGGPFVTKATTATNPNNVLFTSNQLITIAFVPEGVTPPRPPQSVVHALLIAKPATTTTTTTLAVPTTTAPTVTTSTSATTTTTKH